MNTHFDLSDSEFEEQFANCTMKPQLFSHEAHLRLAWIHVTKYGVEQAAENLCYQIQKFDRTFDEGTKYNKTVTVAAAKVLHHFISKSERTTFQELLIEFPRLKTNFKDLIDQHYSFDIFQNPTAQKEYLEPDILPF